MSEERRQQMSDVLERLGNVEDRQKTNTEAIHRIDQNTSEIVEAWKAIVGGLKVLAFLAKVAKWASWIAAGAAAVAAYLHIGNGIRPK